MTDVSPSPAAARPPRGTFLKRSLAWLLTAIALIGIPLWVGSQSRADTAAQVAERGWACGMSVLGLFLFGLMLAALLSLASLLLGGLAYRAAPRPRPGWRLAELLVFSLPLLAGLAVVVVMFAGG